MGLRWPGTAARAGRRRAGRDRAPVGGRAARAAPGPRGADGVNGLSGLVHRAAGGRRAAVVHCGHAAPGPASARRLRRAARRAAARVPASPPGRGAM